MMNIPLWIWISSGALGITVVGGAAAIFQIYTRWRTARKQIALMENQLQDTQGQFAHVKRDYDRAMQALRALEGQQDKMIAAVGAAEAQARAAETQLQAQTRDMDRLKLEIAERPKLKTQTYKIVVIGARSTGKTSLILKWANPIWEVRNPPGATMFNRFTRTVSSVVNPRSNVVVDHVFEIFDFGGERLVEAQETLIVDDVHGLLFVADLGQEGATAIDDARIQQQTEAFSAQALQFFFRAPRIVKSCQTVVLFINKSDLLSGTPGEVEKIARARYTKLIDALNQFAEQAQIEVMIGSSYSGHNTHLLMPHFIRKLLPEDAYDEQLQQRAQGQE